MSDEPFLVRAAQAGNVAALSILLERHRPAMLAVALAVLDRPSDAEDMVQDAMVTALGRIGDLRDPAAIGPWLKTITRNCCRMHLRAKLPTPVERPLPAPRPAEGIDPAQILEQHAARDWLWLALEHLSEPLRVVTLLHYFTAVTSYEQIGRLCQIPVGTVRSRLNKARRLLVQRLADVVESAHPDVTDLAAVRRSEAEQTLLGGTREFAAVLRDAWHPQIETHWADGRRTVGPDPLVGLLNRSTDAGVGQRLTRVVASRELVVWETEVLNPPENPFLCPAGTVWLLRMDAGQVRRLQLFHEPHPA